MLLKHHAVLGLHFLKEIPVSARQQRCSAYLRFWFLVNEMMHLSLFAMVTTLRFNIFAL